MQCRSNVTHGVGIPQIMVVSINFFYTDTTEDMQPNPEVSRKMVNWIEKLGLDKVLSTDDVRVTLK